MDRAIPVMKQILHEKWLENEKVRAMRALADIKQPVFSGRTPNPIPHQRDLAKLKKMLKATSRKHRIEEERKSQINHENRLLYQKMTAILKCGTGNNGTTSASPMRGGNSFISRIGTAGPIKNNMRQETESILLTHGGSVIARPSVQMIKRIA